MEGEKAGERKAGRKKGRKGMEGKVYVCMVMMLSNL